MANYRNEQLPVVLSISRALGDETRARILLALGSRELCVCQIAALFELAPSTLSKHLSVLRGAGMIEARKGGRWIYYRRVVKRPEGGSQGGDVFSEAFAWLERSLSRDLAIRADRQRLREVLRLDPDELCRLQNSRVSAEGS